MDVLDVMPKELYTEYMRVRTGCENPMPSWSEVDKVKKQYWRYRAEDEINKWYEENDYCFDTSERKPQEKQVRMF